MAEPEFRRTARRVSLCTDDAEDAFQRAVEILLTKAPGAAAERAHRLDAGGDPAGRRSPCAAPASESSRRGATTENELFDGLLCERPGPMERAERRDNVAAAARALAELKPDERLAIVLQAQGYSYAEIGELCDWTYTKVNRSLAEGRARLREVAAASRHP